MSAKKARVQELGINIGFLPRGISNSICDVSDLRVGHATLIAGEGELKTGIGPVRTGVTVILPHGGDLWSDRPSAGFFSLNGCGVVTGSDWINECGALEGPIALTNSHSVGDVGKALTAWMIEKHPQIGITDDAYLPVVAECDDSTLNDINGFHVGKKAVLEAIANASTQVPEEGSVGAGTGMTCYGFKGGIGTSSRVVQLDGENYTVGVLVNSNHGQQQQLLIKGVPVGSLLAKELTVEKNKEGSIVMVIATDAPMNQRQLERLCKRACLGLARTGSMAANGSGDFALAFSSSRRVPRKIPGAFLTLPEIHLDQIGGFFQAAVEATEEAVLNSLFQAHSLKGRDGNESCALPVERCLEILRERKVI